MTRNGNRYDGRGEADGKFGLMISTLIPRRLRITRPGGLTLGAAGSVMVRLLVLFSGDTTKAAWFGDGRGLPRIVLPGNARMRWLSCEEWQSRPETLATPPDTVAERYRAGAMCLIGTDTDTGQVIYRLWLSATGAYLDWIFKYIHALPGHMLVFDVWVHPDHRGGNLHWAGAAMACEEAARHGRTAICAGVEAHEFLVFAAKYARFGLGLIAPHSSVLGFKFLGMTAHFRRPPPRELVEFSRRLRARYPLTDVDDEREFRSDPASREHGVMGAG